MNRILMIALLIFSSASIQAAELSQQSLQGSWRVTAFAGEPNSDEDYWEFEGNRFTQNLGGHRLSPDSYEVTESVIDLGYAQIEVIEFDGDRMTARMAGFEYELARKTR